MNYIEQLNIIFAISESLCKKFHRTAREQWVVLLELGFTEENSDGGDCNLYSPTHAEQMEKAPGWPLLSKNGKVLKDEGQLVQYSHGSSAAPVTGIKKSMRTSLGVVIEGNKPETITSWYNATVTALARKLGNPSDLCRELLKKYLKVEYPELSFEEAKESLWLKSYSRPEITADKIIESGIEPSQGEEEEREKREIANFEAVLRTIGNGSRWFFTNQDLTSLAANPSEENLDKVLQNFEAVDLARGEVRGPTAAQMTAALDDYEKRLRQVGDEILDKLS